MCQTTLAHDSVHVGGEKKVTNNRLGDPGFALVDRQSPLAMLIKDLYQLLKVHYSAIDFTSLERYAVACPAQATEEPTETFDYISSQEVLELLQVLESTLSALPRVSLRTSVDDHTEPALAVTAHRVLDTHTEVINTFQKAVRAISAQAAKLGGRVPGDKLQDQFLGLPECVMMGPKAASGSKRKTSDSKPDEQSQSD